MHGREIDRIEVKALVDLANKTMSRFPFKLPKNLALYMRMASILEGIYQHHKVSFQFVKVLANLLEEEGLVRDAYIEDVKVSAEKVWKGNTGLGEGRALLRTYPGNGRESYRPADRNNDTLAASIIAYRVCWLAHDAPTNATFIRRFAAAAAAVAVALKRIL